MEVTVEPQSLSTCVRASLRTVTIARIRDEEDVAERVTQAVEAFRERGQSGRRHGDHGQGVDIPDGSTRLVEESGDRERDGPAVRFAVPR